MHGLHIVHIVPLCFSGFNEHAQQLFVCTAQHILYLLLSVGLYMPFKLPSVPS